MKRLIIIACALLALAGGLALLVKLNRDAPRAALSRDASLQFLGVTNLPAGSFAVFCLSNCTAAHISCMPEAFELATQGAWARTPPSGKAGQIVRTWLGLREVLQPGEGFTFMVPPPTTNGSWRLVFMCQEQARLIDPVTDTVRHLTDTNAAKTKLRQFSGRRYYATSPEVAP